MSNDELRVKILTLKSVLDRVHGASPDLDTSDENLQQALAVVKGKAESDMFKVGVILDTDDLVLITYAYTALTVYLFTNDSNKILDENIASDDKLEALLRDSGTPDEYVLDIMEGITIKNRFDVILGFKYVGEPTGIPINDLSKFILSKLKGKFKYIDPNKLLEVTLDEILRVFDIKELHYYEIIYLFSLFNVTPDKSPAVLEKYGRSDDNITNSYLAVVHAFQNIGTP